MSESPAAPHPGDSLHPVHPWRRYVALGDSFTEGIGDPDPDRPGYHRGWADRVAEELAHRVPGEEDFSYANLAIRGRLIDQIAAEQVEPALELRPDLITVCAGGNDVIRPGGDPDAIAVTLDGLVGRLASGGATVVVFTGPDIRDTPVMGRIRGKVAIYNENVHTVALRHDAVVADLWALRDLTRKDMWAADRLHFSPTGHHTITAMVLETLNVPHDLVPFEPKPAVQRTWRQARTEDVHWAREHLMPWVLRRLRRQSSGDGLAPKRPLAEPLFGHPMVQGSAADEQR